MSDFKQVNIYGKEKDINNLNGKLYLKHGGRISSRTMFRFINGYKIGCYCKNCKNFDNNKCLVNKNDRAMKNDIACDLYEVNNERN